MKTNSHLAYKRLFSTLASQPSFIKDGLKVCETIARLERTGKNFKVIIFSWPGGVELINTTRPSNARKMLIANYRKVAKHATSIAKNTARAAYQYDYKKETLKSESHAEAKTTTK